MISISKERLDRAFFRYDSNRFSDKLMGVIKFSFIPLCIIEGIAAVLLTYKQSLILTLLLFCGFIILDIIAAFIFGIVAIYGMAFIHIIRNSGGISGGIKGYKSAKRVKAYNHLFRNEICSDKVLAEAQRLAETADKQSFDYFSSLTHLVCCHSMRCEFDEAEAAFAELKTLPKNEYIYRNDFFIAAIEYSTLTHNDELFREAVTDCSDVIEKWADGDAASVITLLSVAAHEQKLLGDYETALLYLDWSLIYRIKQDKPSNGTAPPAVTNLKRYNTASIHLDIAECHAMLGDTDKARGELEMADNMVSELSCGVPPTFVKERERIAACLTKSQI